MFKKISIEYREQNALKTLYKIKPKLVKISVYKNSRFREHLFLYFLAFFLQKLLTNFVEVPIMIYPQI